MKELRDKTDGELQQLLAEKRAAVRDMRFRAALRELKNVRDIRKARVLIAQVLCVFKERSRTTHKKV